MGVLGNPTPHAHEPHGETRCIRAGGVNFSRPRPDFLPFCYDPLRRPPFPGYQPPHLPTV